MAEGRPRRDNLYYSANLIGMAVGLYLLLGQLLQAALSAALGANLPGAGAANPAGIPVWAAMLLNCLATCVNLALPLFCLRRWARPLGLSRRPLRPPSRQAALLGIPLFLCYTTLCSALSNLVRILLGFGGYTPPAAVRLPDSAGGLALAFVAICVLPAVLEELFFRGAIQGILAPYGDWFSIIVTSALFALLHSDLSQLPSIFALSLFLGYVAAATKNVGNSILLHFVNNVSSFLLLWSQQQMDGTNAVGLSAILFTLYFGAGLLALAALIRRGGAKKLPRYPTRKNRMGRTERILSAPVFVFMLLILILTAILEYFR